MSYTHNNKVSGINGFSVGKKGSEIDIFNSAGILQFMKTDVVAHSKSYEVTPEDSGKVLTTTGATGAVTFTLPEKESGLVYLFINTVDQEMVIAPDKNDTIVTLNDAAADSVTFSTSSQKIGACALAICDGAKWIVINLSTNTATIAT